MRGQATVAWAQCRQSFGMVKDFIGWTEAGVESILDRSMQSAVVWMDNMKTSISNFSDKVSDTVMTATNTGNSNGEYIPKPWLHGEMSKSRQWEKLVTVAGFVNVYGISISALPDSATPPIPPNQNIGVAGSIVLQTATYNPPNLYMLDDMIMPRFDFTNTMFLSWTDKPVTPMAVPWGIAQDNSCVPAQWETQSWNVNIPIAKHLLPPVGLSIWGYWNSLTQPKLKVKLITAPINS
jgi:hypothetical protein